MNITDSLKQHKSTRQVQKALRKDPNDIRSLLTLAAMLGELPKPDLGQKRQVLHRVLSLEPANPTARAMLFAMDRAEIGGDVSRLSLAVILTEPSSSNVPATSLVLRYSLVHQILVYLFVAGTVFASLSALRDAVVLTAIAVFLLIPLWFVSAVIEIRDTGLNVSRLFGLVHSEIAWNDIRECRPTIMGRGIRIISCEWKTLEVSAQVLGYPFILDILCQMRPDLFESTGVAWTGEVSHHGPAITRLAERTFE